MNPQQQCAAVGVASGPVVMPRLAEEKKTLPPRSPRGISPGGPITPIVLALPHTAQQQQSGTASPLQHRRRRRRRRRPSMDALQEKGQVASRKAIAFFTTHRKRTLALAVHADHSALLLLEAAAAAGDDAHHAGATGIVARQVLPIPAATVPTMQGLRPGQRQQHQEEKKEGARQLQDDIQQHHQRDNHHHAEREDGGSDCRSGRRKAEEGEEEKEKEEEEEAQLHQEQRVTVLHMRAGRIALARHRSNVVQLMSLQPKLRDQLHSSQDGAIVSTCASDNKQVWKLHAEHTIIVPPLASAPRLEDHVNGEKDAEGEEREQRQEGSRSRGRGGAPAAPRIAARRDDICIDDVVLFSPPRSSECACAERLYHLWHESEMLAGVSGVEDDVLVATDTALVHFRHSVQSMCFVPLARYPLPRSLVAQCRRGAVHHQAPGAHASSRRSQRQNRSKVSVSVSPSGRFAVVFASKSEMLVEKQRNSQQHGGLNFRVGEVAEENEQGEEQEAEEAVAARMSHGYRKSHGKDRCASDASENATVSLCLYVCNLSSNPASQDRWSKLTLHINGSVEATFIASIEFDVHGPPSSLNEEENYRQRESGLLILTSNGSVHIFNYDEAHRRWRQVADVCALVASQCPDYADFGVESGSCNLDTIRRDNESIGDETSRGITRFTATAWICSHRNKRALLGTALDSGVLRQNSRRMLTIDDAGTVCIWLVKDIYSSIPCTVHVIPLFSACIRGEDSKDVHTTLSLLTYSMEEPLATSPGGVFAHGVLRIWLQDIGGAVQTLSVVSLRTRSAWADVYSHHTMHRASGALHGAGLSATQRGVGMIVRGAAFAGHTVSLRSMPVQNHFLRIALCPRNNWFGADSQEGCVLASLASHDGAVVIWRVVGIGVRDGSVDCVVFETASHVKFERRLSGCMCSVEGYVAMAWMLRMCTTSSMGEEPPLLACVSNCGIDFFGSDVYRTDKQIGAFSFDHSIHECGCVIDVVSPSPEILIVCCQRSVFVLRVSFVSQESPGEEVAPHDAHHIDGISDEEELKQQATGFQCELLRFVSVNNLACPTEAGKAIGRVTAIEGLDMGHTSEWFALVALDSGRIQLVKFSLKEQDTPYAILASVCVKEEPVVMWKRLEALDVSLFLAESVCGRSIIFEADIANGGYRSVFDSRRGMLRLTVGASGRVCAMHLVRDDDVSDDEKMADVEGHNPHRWSLRHVYRTNVASNGWWSSSLIGSVDVSDGYSLSEFVPISLSHDILLAQQPISGAFAPLFQCVKAQMMEYCDEFGGCHESQVEDVALVPFYDPRALYEHIMCGQYDYVSNVMHSFHQVAFPDQRARAVAVSQQTNPGTEVISDMGMPICSMLPDWESSCDYLERMSNTLCGILQSGDEADGSNIEERTAPARPPQRNEPPPEMKSGSVSDSVNKDAAQPAKAIRQSATGPEASGQLSGSFGGFGGFGGEAPQPAKAARQLETGAEASGQLSGSFGGFGGFGGEAPQPAKAAQQVETGAEASGQLSGSFGGFGGFGGRVSLGGQHDITHEKGPIGSSAHFVASSEMPKIRPAEVHALSFKVLDDIIDLEDENIVHDLRDDCAKKRCKSRGLRLSSLLLWKLRAVTCAVKGLISSRQAFDEWGVRYLFCVRRLISEERLVAPPEECTTRFSLNHCEIALAMHSMKRRQLFAACQLILEGKDDCVFKPSSRGVEHASKMCWESAKRLGMGFWVTENVAAVEVAKSVARAEYRLARNPNACFLWYIALGQKQVLLGLMKSDPKLKRLWTFLSNDFENNSGWRQKALDNAFAALANKKFDAAAGLFLLGGSVRDAISVCSRQKQDIQLALLLCRVMHTREGVEELLVDVLKNAVLDAQEAKDAWLEHIAMCLLHRAADSIACLHKSLTYSAPVKVGMRCSASTIASFYLMLCQGCVSPHFPSVREVVDLEKVWFACACASSHLDRRGLPLLSLVFSRLVGTFQVWWHTAHVAVRKKQKKTKAGRDVGESSGDSVLISHAKQEFAGIVCETLSRRCAELLIVRRHLPGVVRNQLNNDLDSLSSVILELRGTNDASEIDSYVSVPDKLNILKSRLVSEFSRHLLSVFCFRAKLIPLVYLEVVLYRHVQPVTDIVLSCTQALCRALNSANPLNSRSPSHEEMRTILPVLQAWKEVQYRGSSLQQTVSGALSWSLWLPTLVDCIRFICALTVSDFVSVEEMLRGSAVGPSNTGIEVEHAPIVDRSSAASGESQSLALSSSLVDRTHHEIYLTDSASSCVWLALSYFCVFSFLRNMYICKLAPVAREVPRSRSEEVGDAFPTAMGTAEGAVHCMSDFFNRVCTDASLVLRSGDFVEHHALASTMEALVCAVSSLSARLLLRLQYLIRDTGIYLHKFRSTDEGGYYTEALEAAMLDRVVAPFKFDASSVSFENHSSVEEMVRAQRSLARLMKVDSWLEAVGLSVVRYVCRAAVPRSVQEGEVSVMELIASAVAVGGSSIVSKTEAAATNAASTSSDAGMAVHGFQQLDSHDSKLSSYSRCAARLFEQPVAVFRTTTDMYDLSKAVAINRCDDRFIIFAAGSVIRELNIPHCLKYRPRKAETMELSGPELPTWRGCLHRFDQLSQMEERKMGTKGQRGSALALDCHSVFPRPLDTLKRAMLYVISEWVLAARKASNIQAANGAEVTLATSSNMTPPPRKNASAKLDATFFGDPVQIFDADTGGGLNEYAQTLKLRMMLATSRAYRNFYDSAPLPTDSVDHEQNTITVCSHPFLPLYATGGLNGGRVYIWHFGRQRSVAGMQFPEPRPKVVTRLRFSQSGNRIGATSSDGRFVAWSFHLPRFIMAGASAGGSFAARLRAGSSSGGGSGGSSSGGGVVPAYVPVCDIAQCHDGVANDFVFLGCNSMIATAGDSSNNMNVRVWDLLYSSTDPRRAIASFHCHEGVAGGATALCFIPDTGVLVSGGRDGCLHVFSIRSLQPLRTIRADPAFGRRSIRISCLVNDPWSGLLYAGTSGGAFHVWCARSLVRVAAFPSLFDRQMYFNNPAGYGYFSSFGVTDIVVSGVHVIVCGVGSAGVRYLRKRPWCDKRVFEQLQMQQQHPLAAAGEDGASFPPSVLEMACTSNW